MAALLITGCSAGQETQTAEQAPAINGTNGSVGAIDLENVYLHAEVADQPSPIYTDIRLAFTAVNTSQTESDRLVEIESPAAESVEIQGSRWTSGRRVNHNPSSAPCRPR